MRTPRTRSIALAVFVAALLLPALASAQAIPDDIPDSPSPDELDERRENRLKERHHAAISRLFTSARVAAVGAVAVPAGAGDVLGYGVQVGGGLRFNRGDAFYGALDVYQLPVSASDHDVLSLEPPLATVYAASLHYQLGLRRFAPTSGWADRSAVAFGVGTYSGDAGGVSLAVTPEYILPINRFWSLPVGMSLNAILGETPRTFLGLHIGLRTHFGQRKQLR